MRNLKQKINLILVGLGIILLTLFIFSINSAVKATEASKQAFAEFNFSDNAEVQYYIEDIVYDEIIEEIEKAVGKEFYSDFTRLETSSGIDFTARREGSEFVYRVISIDRNKFFNLAEEANRYSIEKGYGENHIPNIDVLNNKVDQLQAAKGKVLIYTALLIVVTGSFVAFNYKRLKELK